MPHKRAKRSVREKARAERKLDLPPSESSFNPHDIPKSMARVLNAEMVQGAWKEKKRDMEDRDRIGGGKKRKIASASSKTEIKIKPGESLRHFKQRVEDDMRPLIRSAMKSTTSLSKQKLKQSQKDVEQLTNERGKSKGVPEHDDSDSEDASSHRRQGKRKDRSPSPGFLRVSSSAPKRLNDVVQAPPELRPAPRLRRLAEKSQHQKAQGRRGSAIEDEEGDGGVITLQQKRMMELEREKAINRYRALKEAKLKVQQKKMDILI
ncbi:hypothetical protein A7U60_g3475 [Sanghuangporus baumii]|uniref:Uncharacterized protein n=1 Tax=Sanghuangporus baumii TaxID=108892 RepID=A0A9Q5I0Q3_SANBA|nr:hypothetical protein A7U60_g3475 [Sanghuangporus baumii]